MKTDVYKKIKELGVELPTAPAKGGVYSPVKRFGNNLLYCSGCGPKISDTETVVGTLGLDLSVEQGGKAAYNCMLNLLANLEKELGDLNKIKSFVKVLAFVRSASDFVDQPAVVNYGSQLLVDIFGEEAGLPARSAIGTNALPGGIAVEIEVVVEIE